MNAEAWLALSDRQRAAYSAAYEREKHRILAGKWRALDEAQRLRWRQVYAEHTGRGWRDDAATRVAWDTVAREAATAAAASTLT